MIFWNTKNKKTDLCAFLEYFASKIWKRSCETESFNFLIFLLRVVFWNFYWIDQLKNNRKNVLSSIAITYADCCREEILKKNPPGADVEVKISFLKGININVNLLFFDKNYITAKFTFLFIFFIRFWGEKKSTWIIFQKF